MNDLEAVCFDQNTSIEGLKVWNIYPNYETLRVAEPSTTFLHPLKWNAASYNKAYTISGLQDEKPSIQ